YNLTAGQVYYIAVRGYSSSTSGKYKIIINRTGWTDVFVAGNEVKYDGTPKQANVVSTSAGAMTLYYNGSTALPVEVGDYEVRVSQVAAGNYCATDHVLVGTFRITKGTKTVTLKAANKSKVFGYDDPANSYELTPAELGDNTLVISGGTYTTAGTAGMARPVGTYNITPSGFVFTSNKYDYVITYQTGTLTVTKDVITVTLKADDKSKEFGQSDPAFTHTVYYNGVANAAIPGNPTKTNGSVTANGTAGVTRPAGTYTIMASGFAYAATTNYTYTIVYQTGTLTVNTINPTLNLIQENASTGDKIGNNIANALNVGNIGTAFSIDGYINSAGDYDYICF
ncbi:MBG domain-containing protein, partial [Treponema sp. R6D11]